MYRLPDHLRPALAKPLGPVLSTRAALEACAGHPVIAVGDVVTRMFFDAGITPHVALVDGVTKRHDTVPELAGLPAGLVQVRVANAPATLSDELIEALQRAMAADTPSLIIVDGEEDLAALPAIAWGPPGWRVVYGQPDQGAVVVSLDSTARDYAQDILSQME